MQSEKNPWYIEKQNWRMLFLEAGEVWLASAYLVHLPKTFQEAAEVNIS
jgi:hypothetical protein